MTTDADIDWQDSLVWSLPDQLSVYASMRCWPATRMRSLGRLPFVTPAKAGVHLRHTVAREKWIPACAGMTVYRHWNDGLSSRDG